MRRPPIDCRRAAQLVASPPLPHVWISDDLLDGALHQFFHRGCVQQLRHGSHVPGPLEAMRRAAKRRMTAQSHVSSTGMPPAFNLAALFGFRANPQPSWRYEPPSVPKASDAQNHHANIHGESDEQPPQTSLQPPPVKVPKEAAVVKIPLDKPGLGRKSGNMLHVMKTKKIIEEKLDQTQAPALGNTDLQACFMRFKSSVGSVVTFPKTRRFEILNRIIRECCPIGELAGDFTLLVLHHLRHVEFSPNTIVSCLLASSVPLPTLGGPKGLEFVRQLNVLARESPKVIRKMDLLYRNMVVAAPRRSKGNPYYKIGLRLLYRAIWENALRSRPHPGLFEPGTISALRDLGSRFSNPRAVFHLNRLLNATASGFDPMDALVRSRRGRHQEMNIYAPVLDCVPRALLSTWISTFARKVSDKMGGEGGSRCFMLLENWLILLRILDARISTSSDGLELSALAFQSLAACGVRPSAVGRYLLSLQPHVLAKALLNWIPYQKSIHEVPGKQVEDFLRSYRLHLEKDRQLHVSRNETLARLLARMHRKGLPNHEIANLIVQWLGQYKGIRTVYDIFRRLKRKDVALSDTTFLCDFLENALSSLHKKSLIPNRRFAQKDVSRLHAARSIQSLQLGIHLANRKIHAMIDPLETYKLFNNIIHNARNANIIPLTYANMTIETLMENPTTLLHQLAYQYSLDKTRTGQQNWRSVYYLYKYLHYKQLPLSSLFTRAMVRICIIRPLSENRFVSSRRLTWVCQKVALAEGVHVARKIEHVFWLWRGNLILFAKRTLHASGGSGLARVDTLKRLRLI